MSKRRNRKPDQRLGTRPAGPGAGPPVRGFPACFILTVLCATLVLSCAGPPPAPVAEPAPAPSPEKSFSAGDYTQAAGLWQQQALSAKEPEASVLRIKAADAWLLAEHPEEARDNLRWIDKSGLTAPERARMNLVLADLALRAERPDEADALLLEAEGALQEQDRARYARLRSRTTQMLSRPGSLAISNMIALSRGAGQYEPELALKILTSLENVPSSELALRSVNPRSDQVLTGWLDLALVIRQNLVRPGQLTVAVRSWKSRHPDHIVSEADALDLWLRYRQQFTAPRKVAILLPESGRFQAAGEAIRDGILDSFLANPGGAELMFISTGADGELATSAYFEAVDRGAQWIIGPLQKPAIEALIDLAGLVTPLLALNELPREFNAPSGLSDSIHGLAFSQEQEVQSIAREVIRAGYHRALVLAPESEWGEKIAQQFSDDFVQDDYRIVASSRYPESENDHSTVLERLLKLDESQARAKSLENTLQMKLEFEPVRRNDADVIFLAANSKQGRLIRPQLRFHYAGDIPVYASGRIFSGKRDRIADQDLNGVRFPTTPFEIGFDPDSPIGGLSSLREGLFAAIFALGRDAWDLLPWLDMMRRDPDFRFPGASGYYHIVPGGRLRREPAFAEFRNGLPAPLTR